MARTPRLYALHYYFMEYAIYLDWIGRDTCTVIPLRASGYRALKVGLS